MHNEKVWNNGTFRLPSFCIGRRLLTLVFCGTTRVMRTNICNAQSFCEQLASADVDRCTSVKSEFTIMVHSDFIAVHRSETMDVDWCPAMPSLVAVASLSDEGRHRTMSKDVGRWTIMEVWTHPKSPHVLKWCNINGAFRLHRCASVDKYLCTQRGWPRAKGRVGKCRLMQSNRSLKAQHPHQGAK